MERSDSLDLKGVFGVLLGIGVIVGGLVCLGGFLGRCQKCSKWFSHRTIRKQKIKEEEGYKDIERSDKHYDKKGEYSGETRRKERVYGKYITYDKTVQCAACCDEYHQTIREW